MKSILIVTITGLGLLSPACATLSEHSVGRDGARLQACPSAPRCVSSFASDERHAIAPLTLALPPEKAWPLLRQQVLQLPRSTLAHEDADYLHIEIVSPWHLYVDDLELLLLSEHGTVAMRSISRFGYYDFQVNRERLEALRLQLRQAGIVTDSP